MPTAEAIIRQVGADRLHVPADVYDELQEDITKIHQHPRRYIVPKSWDDWRDDDPEQDADLEEAQRVVQTKIRRITAAIFWRLNPEDIIGRAIDLWQSDSLMPVDIVRILTQPKAPEHDVFTLAEVTRRLAHGESQRDLRADGYSNHLVNEVTKTFRFHDWVKEQLKLCTMYAVREGATKTGLVAFWGWLHPDLKPLPPSTATKWLRDCRNGEGAFA